MPTPTQSLRRSSQEPTVLLPGRAGQPHSRRPSAVRTREPARRPRPPQSRRAAGWWRHPRRCSASRARWPRSGRLSRRPGRGEQSRRQTATTKTLKGPMSGSWRLWWRASWPTVVVADQRGEWRAAFGLCGELRGCPTQLRPWPERGDRWRWRVGWPVALEAVRGVSGPQARRPPAADAETTMRIRRKKSWLLFHQVGHICPRGKSWAATSPR